MLWASKGQCCFMNFLRSIHSGYPSDRWDWYIDLQDFDQGIVGCTPTNVPLWEIPIYKPYKYHGYTVRGTPNCPLIRNSTNDPNYDNLVFDGATLMKPKSGSHEWKFSVIRHPWTPKPIEQFGP